MRGAIHETTNKMEQFVVKTKVNICLVEVILKQRLSFMKSGKGTELSSPIPKTLIFDLRNFSTNLFHPSLVSRFL